jgi:hypothetical protein
MQKPFSCSKSLCSAAGWSALTPSRLTLGYIPSLCLSMHQFPSFVPVCPRRGTPDKSELETPQPTLDVSNYLGIAVVLLTCLLIQFRSLAQQEPLNRVHHEASPMPSSRMAY